MSVGLLRTPEELKMTNGAAPDSGARWKNLCRRLAREHRRAIAQLSSGELREYLEWVAEQWELAGDLNAPEMVSCFQRLVQQVISHRAMMIRLRQIRRRAARPKLVHSR